MPRYDFLCEICGARADDIFLAGDDRSTKLTMLCPCGEVADRLFPLTSRPVVNWEKPVWSWRHGKKLSSTKEVDIADKKMREPSIEDTARKYAAVDAEMALSMGPAKYEEYKDAVR